MQYDNPIKDLFKRWPTYTAAAAAVDVKRVTLVKWAENGKIPAWHQAAVIRAAQEAGHKDINAQWMVDAHTPQPSTDAA